MIKSLPFSKFEEARQFTKKTFPFHIEVDNVNIRKIFDYFGNDALYLTDKTWYYNSEYRWTYMYDNYIYISNQKMI